MENIGSAGPSKTGALVANDVLVVLAVVAGMVVVLAIGIALGIRSRRRRRHHHRHHSGGHHHGRESSRTQPSESHPVDVKGTPAEAEPENETDAGDPEDRDAAPGGRGRRRVRRRRRDHRPRNPTLAETGGLPPARTDAEEPGGGPSLPPAAPS